MVGRERNGHGLAALTDKTRVGFIRPGDTELWTAYKLGTAHRVRDMQDGDRTSAGTKAPKFPRGWIDTEVSSGNAVRADLTTGTAAELLILRFEVVRDRHHSSDASLDKILKERYRAERVKDAADLPLVLGLGLAFTAVKLLNKKNPETGRRLYEVLNIKAEPMPSPSFSPSPSLLPVQSRAPAPTTPPSDTEATSPAVVDWLSPLLTESAPTSPLEAVLGLDLRKVEAEPCYFPWPTTTPATSLSRQARRDASAPYVVNRHQAPLAAALSDDPDPTWDRSDIAGFAVGDIWTTCTMTDAQPSLF